jgi:Fe-S-cluster containining protein
MGRNDLCFCGSGKKHKLCHSDINDSSIIARLYNLFNKIDYEIENQKTEKHLNVICKKGCSECCSQCFDISESEFVIIIDYIKRNWDQELFINLISTCVKQWEIIQITMPTYAQKLKEYIGGENLNDFLFNDLYTPLKLPFPCAFLDNDTQSCMIYKVRPLICRTHGVSIVDKSRDNIVCSKIPSIFSIQKDLVDLHKIEYEMGSFFILRNGGRRFARRPFPIFYYMNLIFGDGTDIYQFTKKRMYNRITSFSECQYMDDIIQTYT